MLATRLRATFPGALGKGKVFFVNSGSEANDLALRLARAHTNNKVRTQDGFSVACHYLCLLFVLC